MINLRYFCFVVIQLYLKVRALALFYFINLHHYTYITNCQNKIHRDSSIHSNPDVSKSIIHRKSKFSFNPDVSNNFPRIYPLSLAVYSRASGQKQTKYIGIHQLMAIPMYSKNFPRIYLHPLVDYSRAGQPQEWNI